MSSSGTKKSDTNGEPKNNIYSMASQNLNRLSCSWPCFSSGPAHGPGRDHMSDPGSGPILSFPNLLCSSLSFFLLYSFEKARGSKNFLRVC